MAVDWITTSLILDGLRDGKDDAWRQFVARFRDPLVRLGMRRGLANDDAEDVAQRVLLTFFDGMKKKRYERGKGRLSAWLFGIARMEIQRGRREAAKRHARDRADTDAPSVSELPDDSDDPTFERHWRDEILRSALARAREEFSVQTWSAFERVQLGHESPSVVAESLAMTRNAVFIAKHRVLARLREIERDLEEAP